jgi:transposase
VASVPRTWCRTDGIHQVPVLWAGEGSGFTLRMEALVMLLNAEICQTTTLYRLILASDSPSKQKIKNAK